MFVAISPAKKLIETDISAVSSVKPVTFTFKGTKVPTTSPFFIEEARMLNKVLIKFNEEDLIKLMKLSPKLAELNCQRYHNMFNSQEFASMFMFQGDTYQGLQVNTFTVDDLLRGQNQLRMVSGLYGLLRPLDAINPHRLEMVTPLATKLGKNLYEFWGTKLRDWLIDEMQQAGVNIVVNAASPAYAKAVLLDEDEFKQEGIQVIQPKFQDYSKGSYKVIGLFAKKARGAMAKYIIQQQVKDIDDLNHFNLEGYKFDPAESTPQYPVFRRRNYQAA